MAAIAADSMSPVTGLRRKPFMPAASALGSASASARAVSASMGIVEPPARITRANSVPSMPGRSS